MPRTPSRTGTLTRRTRALVVLVAFLSLSPIASASGAPTAPALHEIGCGAQVRAGGQPSHQLPPSPSFVRGFVRTYCTNFLGTSLPSGWGRFNGVPSGDPSGLFEPSHVVVADGMLQLQTYRDPAAGDRWATGGVCQCGLGRTYGAYYVRSRLTGPGDDEVQMLWPVAHVWPPEIDFNETGARATTTAWYVHFLSSNHQVARKLHIDLMRWHTWGLVWLPHSLTFTVDGRVWGVLHSARVIPHEQMTLDFSQQTWCGIAPECPTRPVSMQIDWVAEYSRR